MTSLGVIVARRSSKRLPGKNILPIAGLPLVGWICRAASAARLDRVVVSTENDEIAAICEANGVVAPFRRPEALAADYASSPDIVGHAIETMEGHDGQTYDIVVLLQPTTPFVESLHIDDCLDALSDPELNCAFTAREVDDPPQWMFKSNGDGRAQPLLGKAIDGDSEHSQHLVKTYVPSGAAYAVRASAIRGQGRIICDPCAFVVMDKARSVDIDDALDLAYARVVAEEHGIEPVSLSAQHTGGKA